MPDGTKITHSLGRHWIASEAVLLWWSAVTIPKSFVTIQSVQKAQIPIEDDPPGASPIVGEWSSESMLQQTVFAGFRSSPSFLRKTGPVPRSCAKLLCMFLSGVQCWHRICVQANSSPCRVLFLRLLSENEQNVKTGNQEVKKRATIRNWSFPKSWSHVEP